MLDELTRESETGDVDVAECYADLAGAFDRSDRYESAITAMEYAIEFGWHGRPDPRSDIAEFHLRAGREEQAARIWAELKARHPDDVWLCNAAGLSYSEVGEHELAVDWLAQGIELAMRDDDPVQIVAQLSGVRGRSLEALGRDPDEIQGEAGTFLERSRVRHEERAMEWVSRDTEASADTDVDDESPPGGRPIPVAISWFPAGEYEKAIERWGSLAEEWADVGHGDYCGRLDGHIRWMRRDGVHVCAVSPIVVDTFVAWCADHHEDPEEARAGYAAESLRLGEAIVWPPGRNDACWCGSGRKYKKCCATAPVAPMRGGA